MVEDPQRMKKIAAVSYDYENDPRWLDYWSNILIPPQMASRPDVINHFKQIFYQRYIDPDLVVDAMSSTTSQLARTSSSSHSSAPATEQAQSRNSGFSAGASAQTSASTGALAQTSASTGASARTSASTGGTPANSLLWDRLSIQFSINAWVLVVAVLSVLPLSSRNLSNKAYRLSLLGTGLSSAYSLYSLYGKPRAWNMQAVQVWLQSVIATKDFIGLIYCLLLVSSQTHIKFALIPVLCRSLEHVAKFLRRNLNHSMLYRKYLEEPCLWVESNTMTLSILSSNAEIGLGFLLILSLFSWKRSIILTFMYWQHLKLMYHAPVTAGCHRSVWGKIGRTVNPLIIHYAPFLINPLAAVQRWWLS